MRMGIVNAQKESITLQNRRTKMKFVNRGDKGISIEYEDTDKLEELRVVEQGVAFIKNLIQLHYAKR
jgi:hypothetical protein